MKEYIIKVNTSGKLADECLNVLDAKEIVRCKDCKYHDKEKDINFCDCGNRPDDWFCADGERKE